MKVNIALCVPYFPKLSLKVRTAANPIKLDRFPCFQVSFLTLVEVMQLDIRIRPGFDDGAAQSAARLGRISVIPPQTPVVVAHSAANCHAHSATNAMMIVVGQCRHIVIVVEGSAPSGVAMDQGHAHSIPQRQGWGWWCGRWTGWQIMIQWQRVMRIVVNISRFRHRITRLGIDSSVVLIVALVLVVVKVVLGETNPVGKRLAIV